MPDIGTPCLLLWDGPGRRGTGRGEGEDGVGVEGDLHIQENHGNSNFDIIWMRHMSASERVKQPFGLIYVQLLLASTVLSGLTHLHLVNIAIKMTHHRSHLHVDLAVAKTILKFLWLTQSKPDL